jgi:glycosyltransferase involved in cell wall biosynthesis
MSDPAKISVIVPVYNRADLLPCLIDRLQRQTYPRKELIFIDDGSTDGSMDILRRFPGIVSIPQENRGPASARNTGIRAASGSILHFLDSDVFPPVDLLEAHAAWHGRNPGLIVQGQVIRIFHREEAFKSPMSLVHYARPFFATGNVSVAKSHVEAAGGFDDVTFRKGWEDLDLGLRLRRSGLRVKRLYKTGFVWHLETDITDPSQARGYFQGKFLEGREAVTFYRKHPTLAVRMMTMAHPAFFIWDKILYNHSRIHSAGFYDRVRDLWERGRRRRAAGLMRFAATHHYIRGVQSRLAEESGLKRPRGAGT